MLSAAAGAARGAVKILYVMGRGRSGSTIFSTVLGELDGFVSVGEVRYLWDPVLSAGGECGCGEAVVACPVWSRVLERLDDVRREEVAGWQREVVRERNTLRLLRAPRGRTGWAALDGYATVMGRVYKALAEVTGARVIVDSSKRPSYAALLQHSTGSAPYYLHLVRDPRASAFSWRHRKHQSVRGEGREVTRRNALDSTLRWTLLNLGAEAVARKAGDGQAMTLRFEDFIAAPRPTVERVCAFLGERPAKTPFVDDNTVELKAHHTLAGNPARFSTGVVKLRSNDEEWRAGQSRKERLVTTALSLPFLRRYGYPLSP